MKNYENNTQVRLHIGKTKNMYDRLERFSTEFHKWERKVVFSEKMALSHRSELDFEERKNQYLYEAKSLIVDLGKHDIDIDIKIDIGTTIDNETAFEQFRNMNLHNPEYAGKYVGFVNGSFKDADESESKLVERIYSNYGNVEMFVGKVSSKLQEDIVDTPNELE